ncbi:Gmad2 immunoglobulin-like domain-containing protein [Nocardioides sambongensis]|uniref:Gmad2 immunoglobulin-like domain-containing protein n=1 Tax=Nocardioides sambongensis TaxID=2589074 RepID=UPI00112DE262|nr:Gmad2 immunoglobulin-like domain-containing protein [Nocardioides sambongensis]
MRPHRSVSQHLRRTVPGLAAAVLALGALSACGDDSENADDPATSPAAESSPTEETTTADATTPAATETAGTEDTTDRAAGDQIASPFFVGRTPQGQRLYRELITEASLDGAVTALMDGPTDPDYRTLVPTDSLAGASFDGVGKKGTFTVELADGSWTDRPGDMTAAQARLAVQQLVWTLQTVQEGDSYDPTQRTAAPVDFVVDGERVDYLGVPSGATARPELRILASVNIIGGVDAPVSGRGFEVTGMASSFEANVPWRLVTAGGAVVVRSNATAEGWMGGLYPWTAPIDLSGVAPGEYTLIASTDDPSGGEGGGPTEDSKAITVE